MNLKSISKSFQISLKQATLCFKHLSPLFYQTFNGFQSQVDNLERDSHLSPPWSNLKKLSKIPNQKSTFRDHGSVGIYCLFRGYDFNQITPNYTWFFQKKNQLILSFWEIADYLCVRECIFFARNQVFAIMVPLFGLILLHF